MLKFAGNESRADALQFMRPRRSAGNHRRLRRFDGDRLETRLQFFDDFRHAGDRAAGADARDDEIHLAIRVAPDFLARSSAGESPDSTDWKIAGARRCSGICLFNSSALAIAPFMPFAPSVNTSFAPRIFNSFRRSMLIVSGIVKISFNPLRRRDKRQRNARVAACRLDQDGVLVDRAGFQRVLNHRHADAVLDAGERIEEFQFEQHIGDCAVFFRRAVQPHERCVADGFGDVIVDVCHNFIYCLVDRFGRKFRRRKNAPAAPSASRPRFHSP